MPAEAVHLSALADTLAVAPRVVRGLVPPSLLEAARAGALFVDLPYFDRFAMVFARYLVGRPQAPSRWGDLTHQRAPIRLGTLLGEAGVRLARDSATADAGAYLCALCLGYFSHAALDTAIHPLVNRLAAGRAAALGDTPARQHTEVEKFQSILLHDERNGFDFMGTETLGRHIGTDFSPLLRAGPIKQAVREALAEALGEAPPEREFRGWARGYSQFVWVVSGPLGKRVAPAAVRERERAALYEEVKFTERYAQALERSKRWVEVAANYLVDGTFDETARAALERDIPEQTLDPGPEPG